MTFGELIRQIRTDFEITQRDFAELVEVSRPQVANVERDFSGANIEWWAPLICEHLKICIFYDPKIGWDYER